MRTVRVYSSLGACLRFSFTLFAALAAVLFAIDVATDVFAGRAIDFQALRHPARTIAALTLVSLGLALLLFAIFWVAACRLDAQGLRGFSFWGRRVVIPWPDVASVQPLSAQGIPGVAVTSASSKKQLWICTLGVDVAEVHQHIRTYAGADHVLTRWFTPKGA